MNTNDYIREARLSAGDTLGNMERADCLINQEGIDTAKVKESVEWAIKNAKIAVRNMERALAELSAT